MKSERLNAVKKILLCWLVVPIGFTAHAIDPLTEAVAGVSAKLQPVKTANAQFVQKLETAQLAYQATFTVTRTDNKGKSSEETYSLNLADLDMSTVAYKVERDVIAVLADTKQHRKFIRHTEDGDPKNLTDRLKLYADTPEIAKTLVEALKKTIGLAEKAYTMAKTPDTIDGLRAWLKTAIVPETIGSVKYEQALTFEGDNSLWAVFRRSEVGAKGTAPQESFSFNLGDLALEGLQIETKGNRLELRLLVQQKQKLIGYTKDGKLDDVVSSVELFSADADRIRDLMSAWRKLIPQAIKQLQAKKPVFTNFAVAQKTLEASIKTAKTADRTIEQTLKAECLCTYTRRETNKKNNLDETYEFNLIDLAPQGTKLSVDKELYTVELKTRDNQRVIGYTKNGVRQNYVANLELAADNLEAVRFLDEAFKNASQSCAQSRKSPVPGGNQQARMDWILRQLSAGTGQPDAASQTLTAGASPCELKLTLAEGGRKPSELVYDLALSDLNAEAVVFDVDGKAVSVNLTTKGREKLIKTTKDGKPAAYVHTVPIRVDGIESGRNLAEAFREAIRGCGVK